MYIGGSYGLSIMFLGFVSYNGIFITEVIVAAVFHYCKKITNQMTDLNGKMAFNIGNILNYNEKILILQSHILFFKQLIHCYYFLLYM